MVEWIRGRLCDWIIPGLILSLELGVLLYALIVAIVNYRYWPAL